MPITPVTEQYTLRIVPDFEATTLAELDAVLASYVNKYVRVAEDGKVYLIGLDRGIAVRIDAYSFANYIAAETPTGTASVFVENRSYPQLPDEYVAGQKSVIFHMNFNGGETVLVDDGT